MSSLNFMQHNPLMFYHLYTTGSKTTRSFLLSQNPWERGNEIFYGDWFGTLNGKGLVQMGGFMHVYFWLQKYLAVDIRALTVAMLQGERSSVWI